jgi:Uma2 family endonuclease
MEVVLRDSITGSMTDKEFFKFCLENKNLRIERNNKLEIIIMSPVSSLSSLHSSEIFIQLANWSRMDRKGLVFDSSTGFTLPDRSVLSPDASWMSLEKMNGLTREDQDKFAPVCPDFIIEVRSKSDDLEYLKAKMFVWVKNGAQLAWLIDPRDKTAFIFRPGKQAEELGHFTSMKGEGPVKGFELDLTALKV